MLRATALFAFLFFTFLHLFTSVDRAQLESYVAAAARLKPTMTAVLSSQDLLGQCVNQYLLSTEARSELAAMLAVLLSVGVVRLASTAQEALVTCLTAVVASEKDSAQLAEALRILKNGRKSSAQTSAQKAKKRRDEPLSVHSLQAGDKERLLLLMRAFAYVTVYFSSRSDPDLPAAPLLVAFLCDEVHELDSMPVGAWMPLRTDLEVYHHWKSAVLPSLPISWDSLEHARLLANIGRHCLYFHEEHDAVAPSAPSADGGESNFFDKKVKMGHWGSTLIYNAWVACPPLPWTSLSAQESLQAEPLVSSSEPPPSSSSGPRTGTFSLDMPRRVPTQRKRNNEGSVGKQVRKRARAEAAAAAAAAATTEESSADATARQDAALPDDSALQGAEDAAVAGSAPVADGGLEEELRSLLVWEDIEWTTSQVGTHIFTHCPLLIFLFFK